MGAFVRPRGGVGTAIPIMDFWVRIGWMICWDIDSGKWSKAGEGICGRLWQVFYFFFCACCLAGGRYGYNGFSVFFVLYGYGGENMWELLSFYFLFRTFPQISPYYFGSPPFVCITVYL
jgi:hypothetical protein